MLQKTAPPMNNVVKANNMNGMDKYDAEVVHCETPLKTQIWDTPAPHHIGQTRISKFLVKVF